MSTEPADSVITPAQVLIQPHKHSKHTAHAEEEKNAPSQRRWNWHDLLYLFLLVGLVAAMAYRFTPNFTGEVAGEWWDPLLNMWTLSWDTTTLLHAPTHLWQAQLLYPNNLSLSFSENLLGEAILYAPFFLLSHNPVFAYNMTFYLTFLLCGTNMYIMARHYTGKPFASFVAALIFAFAPYRIAQIDHIHILAGEWMPLAFLYLDLALAEGRWRNWSLFALFYFLQLLSSIYYGIFLTYALLAFVLIRFTWPFFVQLRSRKFTYVKYLLRRAIQPVVVFAIMFIFLGILLAPYLVSLQGGFSRSLGQSTGYAAFVRDFLFTAPFNWLYGISYYNGIVLPYDSEHYLFLGLTTMALAVVGIVLAWRKRSPVLQAYAWTGLIILLFAFGPFLQYSTPSGGPFVAAASRYLGRIALPPNPPNIPMPWAIAYFVLPGFSGLRVPSRLIGVFLIMLALLGAYSVAWLQNKADEYTTRRNSMAQAPDFNMATRRPTRLSPVRSLVLHCLLVLVPFALLIEAAPVYIPVTHVPTGNAIPAVYQWLSTHDDQEPIVELPMAYLNEVFSFKQEAWYDYYAIYHTHPIADGWSGYRPPLTDHIAALMLNFPSTSSLAVLRQYSIRYVVLHLQYYNPAIAASILTQVESSPGLRRVAVFGSDSVWQVI